MCLLHWLRNVLDLVLLEDEGVLYNLLLQWPVHVSEIVELYEAQFSVLVETLDVCKIVFSIGNISLEINVFFHGVRKRRMITSGSVMLSVAMLPFVFQKRWEGQRINHS